MRGNFEGRPHGVFTDGAGQRKSSGDDSPGAPSRSHGRSGIAAPAVPLAVQLAEQLAKQLAVQLAPPLQLRRST